MSDINELGATLNGNILNLGDGASDHGFFFKKGILGSGLSQDADRISLGPTETVGKFSTLANRNHAAGETYHVRAYAVSKTKGTFVFGQEVTFVSQGSVPPKIADISLKVGTIGDSIIITGSGFSDSPANNQVRIGGQFAGISKATPDSLWTTVPMYTPVGESSIEIEVGQQKTQAVLKFTLLPVAMTTFEPASVTFGDTVKINGSNFPVQRQLSSVFLLGKPSSIIQSTRTQIKVVVSIDVTALADSRVQLVVGSQTVQSTTSPVLLAPKITSISPTKGNKDTEVTITGDNFNPTPAKNKVVMAGKTLAIVTASRKSLKVKVPTGIIPGAYKIDVTTAEQTVTSTESFQIVQPVITEINPTNGTWGTVVTITGENFGPNITDNVVTFGNEKVTIIGSSPTAITVTVPNTILRVSSEVKVSSITADNRSATFATPFVLDPPEIISFTPTEGKGQTVVTITGKNFSPVAANNQVKFGDIINAEVVSATNTQLSVKLPLGLAESTVYLTVIVANQLGTSATEFHFLSPWKKITTYPGSASSDATAFALNGNLYVGLGGGELTRIFSKYDPSSDQWQTTLAYSQVSSFGNDFTNVVAFSIGNFGYAGVGNLGGLDRGTFKKYDPITNKWTDAQTLTDKVNNAVGFAIGDKGYVATGLNLSNQLSARLWEYAPGNDTWTAKANLPGPARYEAGAFTINSKAYIVGGFSCFNCSTVLKDLWEYDPATNQWTEKAGLPVGRRGAMGFAINGKGYIVGGQFAGGSVLGEMFTYDPATNQWQQLPNFPGGAIIAGIAVVIGGKAYVGTGSLNGTRTADIWEFDPSKL